MHYYSDRNGYLDSLFVGYSIMMSDTSHFRVVVLIFNKNYLLLYILKTYKEKCFFIKLWMGNVHQFVHLKRVCNGQPKYCDYKMLQHRIGFLRNLRSPKCSFSLLSNKLQPGFLYAKNNFRCHFTDQRRRCFTIAHFQISVKYSGLKQIKIFFRESEPPTVYILLNIVALILSVAL